MIDLFIQMRLLDVIDIIMFAVLLYAVYYLLKGTVAINIFLGIVAIFLIWQTVDALQMELLSTILGAFVSVGFIALIIIFQPEIRRFLFTIGTSTFFNNLKQRFKFLKVDHSILLDTDTITRACIAMSKIKQGALIIITKQNELSDIVQSGVIIDAEISKPLIENIFFKNSPLHDGAMIITKNRIKAARCILPVTNKMDLPGHYGLRHRAAIGVTEDNDSFAIVVSEETGAISLVKSGNIKNMTFESLKDALDGEIKDKG
jgi:TIGR00159 family protein